MSNQRSTGLHRFKCGPQLALRMMKACNHCIKQGANTAEIKSCLPDGITSRKDLDQKQALEFIQALRDFYLILIDRKRKQSSQKAKLEGGEAHALS